MSRCPLRPHPLPLLPPRPRRSLLLPLPPCPVKCNGDALVARFSPQDFLVQKNKGESHKRRPSPCFDFADFFVLGLLLGAFGCSLGVRIGILLVDGLV